MQSGRLARGEQLFNLRNINNNNHNENSDNNLAQFVRDEEVQPELAFHSIGGKQESNPEIINQAIRFQNVNIEEESKEESKEVDNENHKIAAE